MKLLSKTETANSTYRKPVNHEKILISLNPQFLSETFTLIWNFIALILNNSNVNKHFLYIFVSLMELWLLAERMKFFFVCRRVLCSDGGKWAVSLQNETTGRQVNGIVEFRRLFWHFPSFQLLLSLSLFELTQLRLHFSGWWQRQFFSNDILCVPDISMTEFLLSFSSFLPYFPQLKLQVSCWKKKMFSLI